MPKLSVIVPVYNVQAYVAECLNSLLNQTYEDYEVVVVDDGSTDLSGMIAEDYCMRDERYRVIHKENGGLMSAWVRGVNESRGEYIGFVDSDDFVNVRSFEILMETALGFDADIVTCNYERIDESTSMFSEVNLVANQVKVYADNEIDVVREMALPYPGGKSFSMARWNKVFRRNVLVSNLIYCECLSRTFEDRYIVPACLYSADRVCVIDASLFYYRDRAGSNSGMYKPNLLEEILRMYDVQKRVLEDKGLFEQFGANWELAFLDYIRLYVSRNIVGAKDFNAKLSSCQILLANNVACDRMERFGKRLDGKQGFALRLSFRIKSALLLALSSYCA